MKKRRPRTSAAVLGAAVTAALVLSASANAARREAPAPPSSLVPAVDIVVAPPPASALDQVSLPAYARDVPPELQGAIREALSLPALRGSKVSVYAARVSDGAPLVSLKEEELLNPASCVKLFTTAAALRTLRPHHRFATEYLMRGTLDGTTLKGDIIIRGMGDPTVTQERLYKVATEIHARGLTHVTGDVIVDDSYFDKFGEAPGWEQETQADRAYAAPSGALSLNQNALAIYVRPGPHRGAPGVVQVEPAGDHIVIETQVMTTRYGRRLWVHTAPDGDKTRVIVQGVIGLHEPAERYVRRITNPTIHFGQAFLQVMRLRGITVKGRVRQGVTPESSRPLFTDLSPSLRAIVDVLNHHSSNFIAEMLLKSMGAQLLGAPGTTQKGLSVVANVLEREMGVASGSYIMGNGSGLNDINRFSTVHLVKVLRRMALDPTLSPEFMASLAVAGSGGTLTHRMGQTAAEGQLRGKTGTLLGVSALSGYVESPKHGLIAFSIMVNGLQGPASGAWEMQDRIGAAMAGDPDPGLAWARKNGGATAGANPVNRGIVPGGGTP